jgi:hypothetical protein
MGGFLSGRRMDVEPASMFFLSGFWGFPESLTQRSQRTLGKADRRITHLAGSWVQGGEHGSVKSHPGMNRIGAAGDWRAAFMPLQFPGQESCGVSQRLFLPHIEG